MDIDLENELLNDRDSVTSKCEIWLNMIKIGGQEGSVGQEEAVWGLKEL
jgi:hypothetical protein